MSDGTERNRQDTVDGIEYSLKWLVIHVLHKDAVDDIEYSIYVYIWDE